MDKQAEYLRLQIEGGTRTPSGRAIAVPTSNVKLNKYGNPLVARAALSACSTARMLSRGRSAASLASGSGLSAHGAAGAAVAR